MVVLCFVASSCVLCFRCLIWVCWWWGLCCCWVFCLWWFVFDCGDVGLVHAVTGCGCVVCGLVCMAI